MEKWEAFSSQGKSGNFKQTGKVRENHTKYWKTQGISDKYYLLFLGIFKWPVYCLLKWTKFSVKKTKTLKKYWKIDIILEKSGNFVSPEKWEPCSCNCKPWFREPCNNKTNVKHQMNLFQGFAVIMGPQIFPFTLAVRKGTEKIFLAVIFWTVFIYRFVMLVYL